MNRKMILTSAIGVAFAATAVAEGNRYNQVRYYQSEISVTEAYLAMEHSKDFKKDDAQPQPVLLDIRKLSEYAAGHPEKAYNVPYPHKVVSNDQDPRDFYWAVYDIVKGKLDTPIMTMCRTGHRSVLAANILANPDSDTLTEGLAPFTNVRNIWEGFVGQPKYAYNGGTILLDNGAPVPLDLDGDNVISADTADVYETVKDANPDKDGWRNFAGLPWTTHIQKPLAYEQDLDLYSNLNLVPVQ